MYKCYTSVKYDGNVMFMPTQFILSLRIYNMRLKNKYLTTGSLLQFYL